MQECVAAKAKERVRKVKTPAHFHFSCCCFQIKHRLLIGPPTCADQSVTTLLRNSQLKHPYKITKQKQSRSHIPFKRANRQTDTLMDPNRDTAERAQELRQQSASPRLAMTAHNQSKTHTHHISRRQD